MGQSRDAGRFDWLVELGGAGAFAACTAFAATKLYPTIALPAGVGALALTFAGMRVVPPEPRHHRLADFAIEPIEPVEPLAELLLDQIWVEPIAELLLEDRLFEPDPESRVIRLFAAETMPTAGELMERIDRHLATAARPVAQAVPDASQALFAALADLKRSLR